MNAQDIRNISTMLDNIHQMEKDTTTVLTDKEQEIINHLVDAYNDFVSLPDLHPQDSSEFTQYIHILQRQVMARLARRVHPELFGS